MKQIAVLGLGRFGYNLAVRAYELGFDVAAIDNHEDIVQDIADKVTLAVQADVTDLNTLHSLGLQNADIAVISLASDINASLNAVINVQELGIPIIYAKAHNEKHARVLYKLGVDKILFPEKEMGERLAENLVSGNVYDLFELDTEHTVTEVAVSESWVGKSLIQLDLRGKYKLNVIAIKRNGEAIISPEPNEVVREKDTIIVVGEDKTIDALRGKA